MYTYVIVYSIYACMYTCLKQTTNSASTTAWKCRTYTSEVKLYASTRTRYVGYTSYKIEGVERDPSQAGRF